MYFGNFMSRILNEVEKKESNRTSDICKRSMTGQNSLSNGKEQTSVSPLHTRSCDLCSKYVTSYTRHKKPPNRNRNEIKISEW